MRHEWRSGKAALVVGLLGLLALAGPSAAVAAPGDVSTCGDFTRSGLTSFNIINNIAFSRTGTCLNFPPNSTVHLNGHVVSGLGLETGSAGIQHLGNGFILGPGIVKAFSICIFALDHVAVEDVVLNQCATGIAARDSFKIKEVRIHDCRSSNGPNIGIFLGKGGFIESSIVRSCDTGVITGNNNKIWNLVISNHNDTGLSVRDGTAVSRTVISSPRSLSTEGLDYICSGTFGCQDGSNSVQDHEPGLNIRLFGSSVITDHHTNCAGTQVPFIPATGRIATDC